MEDEQTRVIGTVRRLRSAVGAVIRRVRGRAARAGSGEPAAATWVAAAGRFADGQDERDLALCGEIDALLAGRPDPRVVVVTDDPSRLGGRLGSCPDLPGQVRVESPADPSRLHVSLTLDGPHDLLLVDVGDPALRRRLFIDVLLHVRRGGHLVVRDVAEGVAGPGDSLLELVAGLLEPGVAGNGRSTGLRKKHRTGLADALGRVSMVQGHLVATPRLQGYAKIREEEVGDLLAADPARGRVLQTLPGEELGTRATLRESESPRAGQWPTVYAAPAVSLREYNDVVCRPGQVVVQGNVLLPDTYRHNQRPNLANRHSRELAPRFGGVAPRGAELLEGTYFYLDSEFRGHFGHAMTEQLSRMWAWDRAREEVPDLRVLMASKRGRGLAGYEGALYGATGVPVEAIRVVDGPVRVERLLAATPMFSQPEYVHPRLKDTWDRASRNLAAQAPDREYPRRIFCARRIAKRPCRNANEVEKLFADHGFAIVHTEDYPLPEQARMFREAEVIGGFAGSALFNLLLCEAPKRVLMVCSESYTAENERMIAALMGHHVDVAYSVADVEMPPDRWLKEAFHSPFVFDHEREGVFLREALAELD